MKRREPDIILLTDHTDAQATMLCRYQLSGLQTATMDFAGWLIRMQTYLGNQMTRSLFSMSHTEDIALKNCNLINTSIRNLSELRSFAHHLLHVGFILAANRWVNFGTLATVIRVDFCEQIPRQMQQRADSCCHPVQIIRRGFRLAKEPFRWLISWV